MTYHALPQSTYSPAEYKAKRADWLKRLMRDERTSDEARDIAAFIEAEDAKRLATLQEVATSQGLQLTKCRATGGYILARWTHSKHVADLDSVHQMLKDTGADL